MIDEALERDSELGAALADVVGNATAAHADLTSLRRAINRSAASELARRRAPRRVRAFLPASLAAGIAVFLLVRGIPNQSSFFAPDRRALPVAAGQTAVAAQDSIDALLDANVSDGQFRALVSGAGDATDLLAIAAEEGQ
jgi:hypothetical protein